MEQADFNQFLRKEVQDTSGKPLLIEVVNEDVHPTRAILNKSQRESRV